MPGGTGSFQNLQKTLNNIVTSGLEPDCDSETQRKVILLDFVFLFGTALSEFNGTGLGLAISKEIVLHYGGNIWLESRKGQGSTFFFTLPGASESLQTRSTQMEAKENRSCEG